MNARAELESLVAAQFDREVPAGARALAAAARQRCPGAVAVVFYGSCLRDATAAGAVLDFYVLVDSYETTYDRQLLTWLNRLLPPNVFFLETLSEGTAVRAKYAVVTLSAFLSYMADTTRESYFWGRFSQPSAVVYAASPEVRRSLAQGLATAVETFVRNALPLVGAVFSIRELWVAGLSRSYDTELRAEGPDRSAELFASFADYYERAAQLAFAAMPYAVVRHGDAWKAEVPAAERARRLGEWRWRRWYSKVLSLLRVLRNAYTVEGGPEYVMWKIERHTDFRFDRSWRRKPVPPVALVREFWRAWRAGAFR
jgi:hypothetical protein